MTARFFDPRPQMTDASNRLLANGTIAFYNTGTMTPKNFYSDQALTIPYANPYTFGSDGRIPPIWFSDSSASRVIIKNSAGVTLWDEDPYYGATGINIDLANPAPGLGASLVAFKQEATGSVATDLSQRGQLELYIEDFLTDAQITAMRTNVYTGIDMTAFTAAIQAGLNAAEGKTLNFKGRCAVKLNSPIVWPSTTSIRCDDWNQDNGVIFYPDLSVDWPTLYPDQPMIGNDVFYANGTTQAYGFWFGAGYSFRVSADYDALYATFPQRVPDYGMFIWAPNEHVYFERVFVDTFRKHNWCFGGILSVPTLVACGGFAAGLGQNTVFGDTVTRPLSPFGASVTVYYNCNASTTLYMEAAASTDLDTLAAADVLSINGTSYTVTGAPPATVTETERTVIGGVVTTTRYSRRVTLTTTATARGRVFPAGLALMNHPNLSFAPGITAANGGRSSSGSIRLFGFSGDNNAALLFAEGAQNILFMGPKSENNNSMIHLSGSGTGGGKIHMEFGGYRADGFGTADTGLVRISGSARPAVKTGCGQVVSYTNFINDSSPNGIDITTASLYLQGGGFYSQDNSEIPYFQTAGFGTAIVGDYLNPAGNATFQVRAGFAANANFTFSVANASDRYQLRVGLASLRTFQSISSDTGDNQYLWAYNGTITEKHTRLYNVGSVASAQYGQSAAQKIAFHGATPLAQQTITGSRGGIPAVADLITKLANLGLFVDGTTA